jgi:hypothetical protein
MRGRLQIFLPKWEEMAQSAPDLQVVVSRGQIERATVQGEGSGLGTLTREPPPLLPLTDSVLVLALPLLRGRAAVCFSRRRVTRTLLPERRLLLLGSNLSLLLGTGALVGVMKEDNPWKQV